MRTITRRDFLDGIALTIANSDAGWSAYAHATIDVSKRCRVALSRLLGDIPSFVGTKLGMSPNKRESATRHRQKLTLVVSFAWTVTAFAAAGRPFSLTV